MRKDYPTDIMKPAAAMAMLPAKDLSLLYGIFFFPNRLPTMSAIPVAKISFRAGSEHYAAPN